MIVTDLLHIGRIVTHFLQRTIVDIPTALIALVTGILFWRFKKLQEPVVIAGAALLGLVLYPLLHH